MAPQLPVARAVKALPNLQREVLRGQRVPRQARVVRERRRVLLQARAQREERATWSRTHPLSRCVESVTSE
jgi:hypothetical protein